jgi:hypothetical protein
MNVLLWLKLASNTGETGTVDLERCEECLILSHVSKK